MSIKTYKKKIEAYIKNKESAKPKEGEGAKGLLAPKTSMNRSAVTGDQDPIVNISEFIYALRQKRNEFKMKSSKGVK